MRLRRIRKQEQAQAERLQLALEGSIETDRELDSLMSVAELLQPGVPFRESRRSETKDRMLRIAAASFAPAAEGAGTHDEPLVDVHTAEVALPDGFVRVADVEPISPERAAAIAREVTALDGRTEDH